MSGLLTIPVFYKFSRIVGLEERFSVSATLVWAVNIWLARWSASGMEATLAVLLLLLTARFHLERRTIAAGFCAGLTMLTRPELLGVILLFALDRWRSESIRNALIFIGISLLVTLPWHIYAGLTFGTLIPNPARIKTDAVLPSLFDFFVIVKRTLAIFIAGHGIEIVLGAVVLWMLIKGKWSATVQTTRLAALVVCWALIPAAFYAARGVFVQSRYLLVCLPPLLIGGFGALQFVRNRLPAYKIDRWVIPLTGLIVIQHMALMYALVLPPTRAFRETTDALKQMAAYANTQTPADASIALSDVGIFGYYADRRIIDIEGLVSPEVIPFRIGHSLDRMILDELYWPAGVPDYVLDKSRGRERLAGTGHYIPLQTMEVHGAMLGMPSERWFYTLYKVDKDNLSKEAR